MKVWDVFLIDRSELRLERAEVFASWSHARLLSTTTEYDKWFIDTVFFDKSMSYKEVRNDLINHDGYPSNIVLSEAK
jgi:hypothetical protein